MKIRLFKQHDKTPLAELFLESRVKSWHWLNPSKWRLEDFEKFTEDEVIFVAKQDQQYLGFTSIYLQDNFLHHLFVAPNVQNHGVGTELLRSAEQIFTGTGYLKCLTENYQALNFYQKYHWRIMERGHSEDGDYYLMSKEK